MNVNQYKKYALIAKGVVFTADADGLTGVFVNWLAMDSPVDHIIDQGDRIHPERVPFTVGDVFVNRDGTGLTLCICALAESKPVVAFKIDQYALNGKELSFNVI